jgi:hypothetical protein
MDELLIEKVREILYTIKYKIFICIVLYNFILFIHEVHT